ncbi:hypothetical protein NKG05_14065 [Oerskovia sp. M15]
MLAVTDESLFAPQMVVSFAAYSRSGGACSRASDGCLVSYDPETRVAVPSAEVDPRWATPVDPVQIEMNAMDESRLGTAVLFRCLELRGAAAGLTEGDLAVNRQDRIIDDTDTMVQCAVDETIARSSVLGVDP